jgi:hypothetical protein
MVRHGAFPPACLPYLLLSFGIDHYMGYPPFFEANRDAAHGLSAARPIKAVGRRVSLRSIHLQI